MSKTIDQRVVEMQFDNKQFEKNVSTTMSSVDKLKQKLNFNGVAKGFDNISSAAKKVDVSGIGTAVDTVRTKFSALEVMGVTALANLTNSAVNAGKRIVSALTLDPVITGFKEYETQMNAVQTIMANTSSKGTTLEDVNAALAELNEYADQTIYNFTEMTKNIGTFTAAGVDLDKSVTSIKGIANLAAVSGSNSLQASTAMYQLSQALAAGKVSLMDWNSVVNAGMGGEIFQNALKRTATQMGTNVDALIQKYGSFRESLTEGEWLTAEVLTETLTQLSGAYTEAELIAQGYTESQAKDIVELANTAVSAATDVKTFTQLWDTMKEAAQSGWAQTWQLIVGDFEQSKELLSEFGDIFNGIIGASADSRNELIRGAMTSNWDLLTEQVTEAGIAVEDFQTELEKTARSSVSNFDDIIKKSGSLREAFEDGSLSSSLIIDTLKRMAGVSAEASGATEDMTAKLEYFQEVVDKVWRGDYDNGEARVKKLTEAGYDYYEVQSLVNKTVDGHRLTLEDLSDVQLKSIGYTDEEVKKLRELAEQAEKTGTPLNELIENISKPSGRELLWDSLLNILHSVIDVFGAVKTAWQDAFPPMSSNTLYRIIEGFHSLTESIRPTEETIDNLTRTLKGLFAIIDIITTITGGAFKLAFKAITSILGMADVDILSFTATLGDVVVAFRDFIFSNDLVTKGFDLLATGVQKLAEALKNLVEFIGDLPFVQDAIAKIKEGISEFPEIAKWAIEGLKNGFEDGITSIPKILLELGKKILNAIKSVLGINSPSTEMYDVGTFSIQGLINGFIDGFSSVMSVVKDLGMKCIDAITSLPWGKIAAVIIGAGFIYAISRIINVFDALTAPLEGVGEVLESFSKVLDAKAFSMKADAIKSIAIAIAILAASVIALTLVDTGKLWSAIGALGALAAIIGLLAVAIGKFGPVSGLNFGGMSLGIVGIASSILIMAFAAKQLESIDPDKLSNVILGFVTVVGSMGILIAAMSVFVDGQASKAIGKAGGMMLKLSVSMLLMVAIIKLVSKLSEDEIAKGVISITAFAGIISALMVLSKFSGTGINKLGGTMVKISFAILLMVGITKLVSEMSAEEITKGVITITAFAGIISALMLVSRVGTNDVKKVGSTLLAISTCMLIMVGIVALLSGISEEDMLKGVAAITAFSTIMVVLIASVKAVGKDVPKISSTLIAMTISIAALAGIAAILSLIDVEGLAKGVIAVTILGGLLAAMTLATKNAKDIKGNFTGIAIALAVLAVAVAALSFIDVKKLAGATAAMTILMGMFALIVKSGSNIKSSIGTLIIMSVAIGLLAGSIVLIAQLPVESALAASASLSVLLASMSASMLILSKIGKVKASSLAAVAVLGLTMVGLGALLGLITKMDIGPSLDIVTSLSVMLGALSGVCLILAAVGKIGAGAALQGAVALDGVILVVGGLMAAIGALVEYFPSLETFVTKGIGLLEDIGYGIGSFVGNIVGGFLGGITSGLPSMGEDLSGFMENLQPFITGASSINEDSMNGIKALAQTLLILTGAEILDAITSWLTGGSSLSSFAEDLKPFGEAMVEFSEIISGNIDTDTVTAAANAGLTLANLASNLPKEGGLLQDIVGTQDLEGFSSQLKSLGEAIVAFSDEVSGKIDSGSVTAAADAGMMLANLANNIPKQNGMLQDFLGEQDLGAFGEQLKVFGECIVGFSNTVDGKINSESVTTAADAGMLLANLANNIPKQNGILQDFLGEQDLGVFGEQLKAFGECIVNFSETVDGQIDSESVTAAADAGMLLANLANNIPKQNGMLQDFLGEQDLGVFGDQLVLLGNGIASFAQSVNGKIDSDSVDAATNAGMALANLANNIPKQNGVLQNIFGEQNMADFGAQITAFGAGFAAYSDYIKNIDPNIVTNTTNAADSLVALGNSLPENKIFKDETWLDEFGEDIAKFGEYFKTYYDYVAPIDRDKLSMVITQLNRLVSIARDMSDLDTSGMTSFGSALETMGNNGIDAFIGAFDGANERITMAATTMLTTFSTALDNNKETTVVASMDEIVSDTIAKIIDSYDRFKSAGETVVVGFAEGVGSKEETAERAGTAIGSTVVSELIGYYDEFYTVGVNLVTGFTDGMASKLTDVTTKAQQMANAAYTAAMNTLDAHSPSRLFEKVGSYIPLGFANGIAEQASIVKSSATQMAEEAINSTRDTISKLADAINSDIDSQPTIRPVLDLSDVQSKANTLNAMFTRDQAMSISSRISQNAAYSSQNEDSPSPSGATYQFTQNNYSPKALSRVEIYRQTKNQFSAFERVVKT